MNADLSPEFRLLLACIVFPLRPAEIQRLRQQADPALDWDAFLLLVDRHHVEALAYHALSQHAAGCVPAGTIEKLQARFERNRKHNLVQAIELSRVGAGLASERIAACPLKGPALSQQLFGSVGWRHITDLDILVPFEQLDRAERIVSGLGYQRVSPNFTLTPKQKQTFERLYHNYTYLHPLLKVRIELHWRIADTFAMPPAVTTALWQRTRPYPFSGVNLAGLTREDTLAFLVYHGAKHGWTNLKWVADVVALLRQEPELDWAAVLASVDAMHAQRAFVHSFIFFERLLGMPMPAALQAARTREPANESLLAYWMASLLAEQDRVFHKNPLAGLQHGLFTLQQRADRQSRLANFYAFWYNPADWRAFPLPDRFFFLYFAIRPFSWLVRKLAAPLGEKAHRR